MSFMFNPYPYDDQNALNTPNLKDDTVNSIITGTKPGVDKITTDILERLNANSTVIIALDGYIGAQVDSVKNLLTQNLTLKSVEVEAIAIGDYYKSSSELEEMLSPYLPMDLVDDPVLLFGKIFEGGYATLFNESKFNELSNSLSDAKNNAGTGKKVIIVYGNGSTVNGLRDFADMILFFDVTPKEAILRIKGGMVKNLGDDKVRPYKELMRRCYYYDFELACHLRKELFEESAIDYYIANDNPANMTFVPGDAFNEICEAMVKYPFRCKPVYNEGVWGGYYFKNLRKLPEAMKNCAWVFDLIPLEVSMLIQTGENILEIPYFTFVQKEGKALMGEKCVEKFGGYFPIRFNYDDTFHSSGNMSIQVHPTKEFTTKNNGEKGAQDESYYIVAAGHDAKTYLGFQEDLDPEEFFAAVRKSETEHVEMDYEKYVDSVPSTPGVQVMIPAGTIHSSGRNQVVLEIGSLTVGSYTYKLYDYQRIDFDGKPRPIHSNYGEEVLQTNRRTNWVKENIVQTPQVVREGEGFKEEIVGEHDLMYFSLRRLEFEKEIECETNGVFHVLSLVDGEKVKVYAKDNPEQCYKPNYLDIIVVPANIGTYVIENLGDGPACVHKTHLKENFDEA